MTTQKKYRDLVLIDNNIEPNHFSKKKLMSVLLLFLIGVGIGSLIVSVLGKGKIVERPQVKPTISSISADNRSSLQEIASKTSLQSITNTAISSRASSGCSIESLGRNPVGQGCSVDGGGDVSSSEIPANVSTNITTPHHLTPSKEKTEKTTTNQETGLTNILDLQ
jgi:hypothetical protein